MTFFIFLIGFTLASAFRPFRQAVNHYKSLSPTASLLNRRYTDIVSTGRVFSRSMSNKEDSPLEILQSKNNDELSLPENIQNVNKFTVGAVKNILVWCYGDRPYARFAALETIARVPYFSYTSVLHLYETMGWFRKKEYIEMHFAESWNELHHLLIMEELGGNKNFADRFIAQHIAFFYYWLVVGLYMTFPAIAYDLNKHVETHAFETYSKYLRENENTLKQQPPPKAAIDYYEKQNPYLFDAFQSENIDCNNHMNRNQETSVEPASNSNIVKELVQKRRERQRKISNLYDVFERIRDDEAEHAKTMFILQRDMTQSQKDGGNGLL